MITLELDGNEYKIANAYDELSLGQYIDIVKLGESKDKFKYNESDIKIIATLSDKPKELEKALWTLNIDEFNELTPHFEWVGDTKVIDELKQLTPLDKIIVNGKPYGIISNHNKMTMGEMVSLETLMAEEHSDLHRLHIAFGILIRPIDDKGNLVEFTQEAFDEVIDNRYNILMKDVYAAIAFFLSGETGSTIAPSKRFSIRK